MGDEKQIEELTNELVFTSNYGTYNAVANYLVNKGYRKQSEGEWIKHPASYECTACKEEFFVEGYAEDYDPITDWGLRFCPNCGAKMRKEDGNEQRGF